MLIVFKKNVLSWSLLNHFVSRNDNKCCSLNVVFIHNVVILYFVLNSFNWWMDDPSGGHFGLFFVLFFILHLVYSFLILLLQLHTTKSSTPSTDHLSQLSCLNGSSFWLFPSQADRSLVALLIIYVGHWVTSPQLKACTEPIYVNKRRPSQARETC